MNKNKTAAIAIDRWKFPIFKRRLENAGFTFTENPGLTANTMILKVPYDEGVEFVILSRVVRESQFECAVKGGKK